MPQAYCTECRTHVTVRQGACLAGHQVNTPLHRREPGRHSSRADSGSTLAVALRQVRKSLVSSETSPSEGRHRQPGSERPPTPELVRRPEDTKRTRWPLNGKRPPITPEPSVPLRTRPGTLRRPSHPTAPVSRINGVGSPLLELLGMAEPPTSLTGPHLPPPGRSAPTEAPPTPLPSPSDLAEPPPGPPEVAPAGPVRPAPSDPPSTARDPSRTVTRRRLRPACWWPGFSNPPSMGLRWRVGSRDRSLGWRSERAGGGRSSSLLPGSAWRCSPERSGWSMSRRGTPTTCETTWPLRRVNWAEAFLG